jgi:hypothetical protein
VKGSIVPHLRLCQLTQTNSKDCRREVPVDFPMDLCEMHALMTVAVMLERGGAAVKRVKSMYDTSYVRRVSRGEEKPRDVQFLKGRPTVVYYLRFGDHVKIGTSRNLLRRLSALQYHEVLAIEPGDRLHERLRHSQFESNRSQGEWFELDADLEDHVAHIKETYGEPFQAWKKWSALADQLVDTPS